MAQRKLWAEALREKAEKGWGDDNPVWLREYMGEWAADNTDTIFKYRAIGVDGEPWNQWDPERVGPMRLAKLPTIPGAEWLVVFGADMGHSDPFALTAWAYSPQDRTRSVYQIYEFERPKMYAKTIAQVLLGENDAHPLGVHDAADPKGLIGATGWPTSSVADVTHLGQAILDELANVYGVRFQAAKQKDKYAGIEQVNGWLIDGRVKVLKGSLLEAQLQTLQWQQNEFGELKENKAQANHLSDSMLYALREIAAAWDTDYQDGKQARAIRAEVDPAARSRQVVDDEPMPKDDPWGAFGQDLLAPGEFVDSDF